MKSKVFLITTIAIMTTISIIFTGCTTTPKSSSVADSLTSNGVSINSISESASQESQISSEITSINSTSDTSISNGSVMSNPVSISTITSAVTNPNQGVYPTTPGEPSKKKLPQFAYNLKDKTINFLTSGVLAAELQDKLAMYKQLTGVELKVAVDIQDWRQLPEILAKRVLSGNAPDLFIMGAETAPFLINKGYFQATAPYVNMNDALFADLKEDNLIMFAKDKKQYGVSLDTIHNERTVFYNKKLFREAELDDPLQLFKLGKWDWDAFYLAAKELTIDKDKNGVPEVYGASLKDWVFGQFTATTGSDAIKFNSNGTIVNNLNNAAFQRTADFANKLGKLPIENLQSDYMERFSKNLIGMTVDHAHESQKPLLLKMKMAGNLGIVPMPKDPKSDKYYQLGNTYYYFIPKNCDNPYASAAWLYFERYLIYNSSPVIEKQTKDRYLTKWYWTEEEYKLFKKNEVDKYFKLVVNKGERVPDFSKQPLLWALPFVQPWSTVVQQVNPAFQAAIDKYNKSLG